MPDFNSTMVRQESAELVALRQQVVGHGAIVRRLEARGVRFRKGTSLRRAARATYGIISRAWAEYGQIGDVRACAEIAVSWLDGKGLHAFDQAQTFLPPGLSHDEKLRRLRDAAAAHFPGSAA